MSLFFIPDTHRAPNRVHFALCFWLSAKILISFLLQRTFHMFPDEGDNLTRVLPLN